MANMMDSIPNLSLAGRVLNCGELVDYREGSVVSREIMKKPNGKVTLFAFDKGEGLSEHTSPFDAMVQILEGEAEITISGHPHRVKAGEFIIMPANQPHGLKAVERYKMILTMLRG
jgi:quercetin dioxygenase-like cupin family protein